MRRAAVRALLAALALGPCACGTPSKPAEDLAATEVRGVSLLERYDEADRDKALEALADVVRRSPEWREARINYAIALAATKKPGETAEALAQCERVLADDPREPHALFVAALVRRFQGQVDAAKPLLERLLEVDPDEPSVWYWLGTVELEGDHEDLAKAEQYLRKAVALAPGDLSAAYALFQALTRAGKGAAPETAALQKQFQEEGAAKDFGSGAFVKHRKRGDSEYGEAGKYAHAIRDFAAPTGAVFSDATAGAGLPAVRGAAGLACGDLDGDGDDDLVVVDAAGTLSVLRDDGGRFADATATAGLPVVPGARAALAADVDDDGLLDVAVVGQAARVFVHRPAAAGAKAPPVAWDEMPAARLGAVSGSLAAMTWADVDHDGDLDLVAAGEKALYLRNRRDGAFGDATAEKAVAADHSTGVVAFDADGDGVTDLVFFAAGAAGAPPRLLRNGRLGPFVADARLDPLGPAISGTVGHADGDGSLDLVLVRPDGAIALARGDGRGGFALDPSFPTLRLGAKQAAIADFDADGRPDVLAVGERVSVVRGLGGGRWRVEGTNLPEVARSAMAIADVDGDGDLDVVLAEATGLRLLRNESPRSRHTLRLRLRGVPDRVEGRTWSNVRGVGAEVDVKAGDLLAKRVVLCGSGFQGQATTDVLVGLGERERADFAYVHWTDGVLQSEPDVPVDAMREIVEVNRKIASCPVVFAWDGKGYAYVTDCLGVGGLGFYSGPAIGYAPPDPTEVLALPPLAPKDGAFAVSLVENLEEVSYLDEARLLVVDHDAGLEVHPDERFAVEAPMPEDRLYAVRERVFPASATDDAGHDVRASLLEDDRQTVDTFRRDPRFVGLAEMHALTLDFGDRGRELAKDAGPDGRLVLFLSGWIEYGYSKTYVGSAQAGVEPVPPTIEVEDGAGGWKKALTIGYPAGNPRTMTVDVTTLVRAAADAGRAPRLRIRSNLEVYWDRVFLARDENGGSAGALRVTTLPVTAAELTFRGYPREFTPDGRAPTLYDYSVCEAWVPFRSMPGAYTRFGDVTPLVTAADDRFAIFGKGEQVALRFDASSLPALEKGRARTFLLRLDGYCKDRDPYTALGDTVEPLPFHAMSNYPYAASEHYPDDAAHREYRARWNTRVIR